MSGEAKSIDGEYGRHFKQLHQKYGALLRGNFFSQLGDASEADACVWETFGYFFSYMNERPWEANEKLIKYRLKMIAGGVCTRKLAEKRARVAYRPALREKEVVRERPARRAVRHAVRLADFKQTFLRAFGFAGEPKLKHVAAFR